MLHDKVVLTCPTGCDTDLPYSDNRIPIFIADVEWEPPVGCVESREASEMSMSPEYIAAALVHRVMSDIQLAQPPRGGNYSHSHRGVFTPKVLGTPPKSDPH